MFFFELDINENIIQIDLTKVIQKIEQQIVHVMLSTREFVDQFEK